MTDPNAHVFKGKLTKKKFEAKLIGMVGHVGLAVNRYDEYDHLTERSTRVNLYYLNDRHVGSWSKGTGWIFASALTAA